MSNLVCMDRTIFIYEQSFSVRSLLKKIVWLLLFGVTFTKSEFEHKLELNSSFAYNYTE
jgi:hypothetical protein